MFNSKFHYGAGKASDPASKVDGVPSHVAGHTAKIFISSRYGNSIA